MTKQTVFLNNFARKRELRLQFLRQSAFSAQHCWRGQMTYTIIYTFLPTVDHKIASQTCLNLSQTSTFRLSKLTKLADDNLKSDENSRKFYKWVENTVGKGEIAHYELMVVLQTCKIQGLFWNGIK